MIKREDVIKYIDLNLNMTRIAKALEITRKTLYYRMELLKLLDYYKSRLGFREMMDFSKGLWKHEKKEKLEALEAYCSELLELALKGELTHEDVLKNTKERPALFTKKCDELFNCFDA